MPQTLKSPLHKRVEAAYISAGYVPSRSVREGNETSRPAEGTADTYDQATHGGEGIMGLLIDNLVPLDLFQP